jgi:hypothetical protein
MPVFDVQCFTLCRDQNFSCFVLNPFSRLNLISLFQAFGISFPFLDRIPKKKTSEIAEPFFFVNNGRRKRPNGFVVCFVNEEMKYCITQKSTNSGDPRNSSLASFTRLTTSRQPANTNQTN